MMIQRMSFYKYFFSPKILHLKNNKKIHYSSNLICIYLIFYILLEYSCQQNNGDLTIFNPTFPPATQTRSVPAFTEFQYHPTPEIWWWVICVTFETGGAGLGISKYRLILSIYLHFLFMKNFEILYATEKNPFTKILLFLNPIAGLQRPGGAQGINPNVLKSLTG